MKTDALITLDRVEMVWEDRRVLSTVDLSVNVGDFLAVTGPNGGGKTTLLRIMLKLLAPTHGTVTYNTPDGNLSIGYLPQKHSIDSRFPVTVEDVVASGLLGLSGLSANEKRQRVRQMIELVDLGSHARQPIGRLSGGQLQRALFGRALAPQPRVLVLDEPLSYLDRHFTGRLREILASLKGSTTIVMVSHEMSIISELATRHLIVDHTATECVSEHHAVHYDCFDRL